MDEQRIMKKLLISGLVLYTFLFAAAFSSSKADWGKMDSNNDGYISPKEMKEHYKKVGVCK